MKKVLSLVLSLLMILSTVSALPLTAFAAGELTQDADGYYLIADYADLKAFATLVNGGATGANAKLTEDFTATDTKWTPIGNESMEYFGTFDGDEHTITGLSNETSGTTDCAGLFGIIGDGGVVKSVNISGGYLQASVRCGGIVGCNNGGVVEECTYSGIVLGVGDNNDVGGIAGNCRFDTGAVRRCGNAGNVSGHNAGGVVGYLYDGTVVEQCFNVGSVSGDNVAGGIVGYLSDARLRNCCNTGTVSGSSGSLFVGGVVGHDNNGKVRCCCSNGSVSGGYDTGGVAGLVNEFSNNNFSCVTNPGMEYCYYDTDKAPGLPLNDDDSTGHTKKSAGLTTAQFGVEGGFNGFDFDTVWVMFDAPALYDVPKIHEDISVTATDAGIGEETTITVNYPANAKGPWDTTNSKRHGAITVKVDDNEYGTMDGDNGVLVYNLPINNSFTIGTHTVETIFNGNEHYVSATAETSFSVLLKERSASTLQQGDTFEMGMYPQSKVDRSSATYTALEAIDCTLTSFGYPTLALNEAGEVLHVTVDMSYADIEYDGAVYRKVVCNECRGEATNYTVFDGTGTDYYQWEPIEWQVIAQESDGVYVMSKMGLDAQPYHDDYNAETINWENCTLRPWLNGTFYNAAFSTGEKEKINLTTVPYAFDKSNEASDTEGNATQDYLWILSTQDVIHGAYGFSSNSKPHESRIMAATDYAYYNGCPGSQWVTAQATSRWWQRNVKYGRNMTFFTDEDGKASKYVTFYGNGVCVRPAFKLNLDATVGIAEGSCIVTGHKFEDTARYCLNGCGAENPNYTGTPANTLQQGDTFEMGMYPQTRVTDDATITALEAIDCTMTSYGYIANYNKDNGNYDNVDMTYADIAYNGDLYRKVNINEYRPSDTTKAPTAEKSNQDNNGYEAGNTYYFKWEPVVWQVLAKEADGVRVMSESLLDSQDFYKCTSDTITWETGDLRSWLNGDFCNAVFSEGEKGKIVPDTHENGLGNNTTDTLWLLSQSEVTNSAYGFSSDKNNEDVARRAQGTDYAKSQGITVLDLGCSEWSLRSVVFKNYMGYNSNYIVQVHGEASSICGFGNTELGVRPAFKLDLDSTVGIADAVSCRVTGKHTYGNWEPDDGTNHKKVCTACGDVVTEIHSWNTEWSKDDEKHWHECTDCGAKKDEAEHSYGGWTPVDDNTHKHTCVCGAEETATHTYGTVSYEWTKAGNDWKATASRKCSDCKKEQTETVTATGVPSQAPTCTDMGETIYTATFVNPAFTTQTKTVADIPANGHSYETVTTDPTCTEQGYTTYTCTVCGDTYDDDFVPANGHSYETVTTDPTCTEQGWTTYTCTVCGDTYDDDYVPANGHSYETVTTDPTCTEQGWTTYTCTVCGDTYDDDYVPANGHSYEAVTTDPTCTEQGWTTYTCTVCGDTYDDDFTDALGHTYGKTGDARWICQRCGETDASRIPVGWDKDGGKWYYYKNGVKQQGWLTDGDYKYYLDPTTKAMITGWKKLDGNWYYFNIPSGAMAKYNRVIDGKQYYFNSQGVMKTGWVRYIESNEYRYFGADGAMITGWRYINGNWYYLHPSDGYMHRGWLKDGGKWYYFIDYGPMVTGTKVINGKTYTFDKSGVCLNP